MASSTRVDIDGGLPGQVDPHDYTWHVGGHHVVT